MSAAVYDGVDLAGEVYDLIRRRLPRLPDDDPLRPKLAMTLPGLGDALGLPRVQAVESGEPLGAA